jgi:hypothetical protein
MRKILLALAAALVAGCANFYGYGVAPGTSRDEVIARFGPPQRAYQLPTGERLQYSQQPAGRTAWMIDLDASGRVVAARQVLTEANFNRIVPGQWTFDDVQREFGPPAWVDHVSSWNGPVLNYRWQDLANNRMFYWIYLDNHNVVGRAHPGIEFLNGPNDSNRS